MILVCPRSDETATTSSCAEQAGADAAGAARAVRPAELAKYITDEELGGHRRRLSLDGEAKHELRSATSASGGATTPAASSDFQVEVNEGEVVLDIIHRLQATQTPDLACRWNCKAGKCGSCSMEINGMPRLGCMTRMSTFEENETVTVTPLRTFPVIRDLVTDVSFNYNKAREMPAFAPPPGWRRASTGCSRSTSSARRSSASASSASSARTPATWSATTRRTSRRSPARASSSGPPSWTCTRSTPADRKEYAQEEQGLGYCNITKCCTEVCPEHIKITDNAIIPMKERVVDRKYDPLVWLGRKIFKRSGA